MRIALLQLVALTALSAACMPNVEEPEVTVEGISLGAVGLQGGVLNVSLRVVNPNGFDLEASGLSYDVDFRDGESWIDFAEGDFPEEIRVPGEDSARVRIPVEFRYSAVGSALRSMLDIGTIDYRIAGQVRLEEPLRRGIPFRKSGQMQLGSQ